MPLTTEKFPKVLRPLLRRLHVDFRPLRSPSTLAVIGATITALVGSLVIDYLLVRLGTTVFPSTRGFVHFRFSDYGKLTVIGVVIACIAWPITTRITSTPRWLFLRAAFVVTVVLLAPDAYIWLHGEPIRAVFVLVWMHLAIAIITYNALVRLAPAIRARHAR